MSTKIARFSAVDALRGLIMIFMAIDHTNAFVSRQHSSEYWNGAISTYDSTFAFVTRWITHLCAPGFFFLMGAGIYWFASSRQDAGWTAGQVARRTASRGLAIFLVGQIFEGPLVFIMSQLKAPLISLSHRVKPPANDGSSLIWAFITLSGLGLAMMLSSLLLRLRPAFWLLASAACVVATHSLLPADGKTGSIWLTILLAPGLSNHLVVSYPVLPWFALTALGMYFGYWWKTSPEARNRVWLWGVVLISTGITLRAAGGWGNIVVARDASWIEFFNNVKYPPSLVFWTISVGVDLLLLAALMRLPEKLLSAKSPLMVFGQAPLFFYVTHFYVLAAIGLTLFPDAAPLEITYAVWLVLLGIMYPLCLWYRFFKMQKPPESLWRLF